jgi:hypothetical protein
MSEELGINEWELLSLFGDHVSRAYGEEWYDSDSVYQYTDKNKVRLTFAIHPVHKDVRMTLSTKEVTIYDWQSQDLIDIRYTEQKERTIIELLISETNKLTVRLNPTILIEHKTRGHND